MPRPVLVPQADAERIPVEVDGSTQGLKDAVVWLEGVPLDRSAPPPAPVVHMDQENFFFVPHVLAIRAGQEVEFTNGDPPNHAVMAHAAEPRNSFNIATPPGGRVRRRFWAAKRPVAISCPMHEGMAAWVYVFEHPYFAVTDARGRFRLPPVPPERYVLHVDHAEGLLHRRVDLVAHPDQRPIAIPLASGDRRPSGDGKQ